MAQCQKKSIGKVPLCDDPVVGLYGIGGREMPPERQVLANLAGEAILPRIKTGVVDDQRGVIVLLCIGMSNAQMTATAFERMTRGSRNVRVKIVNACQFGQDLRVLSNSTSAYWLSFVSSKLVQAGLSNAQVSAVWCMEGVMKPAPSDQIKDMWSSVYDICRDRFPNAKQFLADSINYMGYSDKAELNEPGAYEQGVALRDWIAAERGFDEFPIMWGAYMWADGETERADDGFNAVCPLDYMADGIHPSNPLGAEGLAELLKDRMTELSETAVWFAP